MKKFILRLDLHDDKAKQKALKTVSTLSGIDSIAMDMKEKKLTVIGSVDPVNVVSKLRKYWPTTDIISVGPAVEPKKEEPKKEEAKKEEGKKEGEEAKKEGEEAKKEEPKKEEEKKEGGGEEAKKEEPTFLCHHWRSPPPATTPLHRHHQQSEGRRHKPKRNRSRASTPASACDPPNLHATVPRPSRVSGHLLTTPPSPSHSASNGG